MTSKPVVGVCVILRLVLMVSIFPQAPMGFGPIPISVLPLAWIAEIVNMAKSYHVSPNI